MSALVILAILASIALSAVRPFVPTAGLSWTEAYKAAAHIYAGFMLAALILLWHGWILGWICLAVPTTVELVTFLRRKR